MELIFASHNENKVQEIRKMLPESIQLLSLNDIDFHDEIEETGSTLEENARIKAETIFKLAGKPVFADDSGLFVEALGGAPGVYSARYAGTGNTKDNIIKLLAELGDSRNRSAYFMTIFCMINGNGIFYLDGKAEGKVIEQPRGMEGFGYDPVFVPDGFTETFAEMAPEKKNQISHRSKAVHKLINFVGNLR